MIYGAISYHIPYSLFNCKKHRGGTCLPENDFLGRLNLESNILIYFLSFEGAPVQGLRDTIFLNSEIVPLDKTLPARYWY